MKEVDLSPTAKHFLKDRGCIELHGEAIDIDLVGIDDKKIIHCIELKTNLNLKVLEQAQDRLKYCNYVYIGIPYEKIKHYRLINKVYRLWLETHGIGLVGLIRFNPPIHSENGESIKYTIHKHAKINRNNVYKETLLKNLNEFTKDKDGGYASGAAVTPYTMVVNEVQIQMWQMHHNKWNSKEWLTINEILKRLDLLKKHYSNPRAGLYRLLNAGWNSDWVEKHKIEQLYKLKLTTEPKYIWR